MNNKAAAKRIASTLIASRVDQPHTGELGALAAATIAFIEGFVEGAGATEAQATVVVNAVEALVSAADLTASTLTPVLAEIGITGDAADILIGLILGLF